MGTTTLEQEKAIQELLDERKKKLAADIEGLKTRAQTLQATCTELLQQQESRALQRQTEIDKLHQLRDDYFASAVQKALGGPGDFDASLAGLYARFKIEPGSLGHEANGIAYALSAVIDGQSPTSFLSVNELVKVEKPDQRLLDLATWLETLYEETAQSYARAHADVPQKIMQLRLQNMRQDPALSKAALELQTARKTLANLEADAKRLADTGALREKLKKAEERATEEVAALDAKLASTQVSVEVYRLRKVLDQALAGAMQTLVKCAMREDDEKAPCAIRKKLNSRMLKAMVTSTKVRAAYWDTLGPQHRMLVSRVFEEAPKRISAVLPELLPQKKEGDTWSDYAACTCGDCPSKKALFALKESYVKLQSFLFAEETAIGFERLGNAAYPTLHNILSYFAGVSKSLDKHHANHKPQVIGLLDRVLAARWKRARAGYYSEIKQIVDSGLRHKDQDGKKIFLASAEGSDPYPSNLDREKATVIHVEFLAEDPFAPLSGHLFPDGFLACLEPHVRADVMILAVHLTHLKREVTGFRYRPVVKGRDYFERLIDEQLSPRSVELLQETEWEETRDKTALLVSALLNLMYPNDKTKARDLLQELFKAPLCTESERARLQALARIMTEVEASVVGLVEAIETHGVETAGRDTVSDLKNILRAPRGSKLSAIMEFYKSTKGLGPAALRFEEAVKTLDDELGKSTRFERWCGVLTIGLAVVSIFERWLARPDESTLKKVSLTAADLLTILAALDDVVGLDKVGSRMLAYMGKEASEFAVRSVVRVAAILADGIVLIYDVCSMLQAHAEGKSERFWSNMFTIAASALFLGSSIALFVNLCAAGTAASGGTLAPVLMVCALIAMFISIAVVDGPAAAREELMWDWFSSLGRFRIDKSGGVRLFWFSGHEVWLRFRECQGTFAHETTDAFLPYDGQETLALSPRATGSGDDWLAYTFTFRGDTLARSIGERGLIEGDNEVYLELSPVADFDYPWKSSWKQCMITRTGSSFQIRGGEQSERGNIDNSYMGTKDHPEAPEKDFWSEVLVEYEAEKLGLSIEDFRRKVWKDSREKERKQRTLDELLALADKAELDAYNDAVAHRILAKAEQERKTWQTKIDALLEPLQERLKRQRESDQRDKGWWISMQAANDLVVDAVALNDGTGQLVAREDTIKPSTRLHLVKLFGEHYRLRAHNRQHAYVDRGRLVLRDAQASDFARGGTRALDLFERVDLGLNKLALRARATGRYITLKNGVLEASATSAGENETFRIIDIDERLRNLLAAKEAIALLQAIEGK